jgi:hypothetical protein
MFAYSKNLIRQIRRVPDLFSQRRTPGDVCTVGSGVQVILSMLFDNFFGLLDDAKVSKASVEAARRLVKITVVLSSSRARGVRLICDADVFDASPI